MKRGDLVRRGPLEMKKHRLYVLAWALTLGFLLVPLFGWGAHQMPITFRGYTRAETLTNFPALVTFTNYNGFLSSSGYDLRFWTNSAATGTPLNYEIESWNVSTTSFVWVQVPLLTSNTTIYATWGNAAYSAQASYTTNGSTWSDGYASVFHFGSASLTKDSGTNLVTGTITGSITATNGIVGGGMNSPNSQASYMLIASNGTAIALSGQSFAFGAWVYPRSVGTYQLVLGKIRDSNYRQFSVYLSGAGTNNLYISMNYSGLADYGNVALTTPWAVGRWNHIEVSYYAGNILAFVNGVQAWSTPASASLANQPNLPTTFGGSPLDGAYPLDGLLDEARLSYAGRSPNWVYAEYLNMASNTVFSLYGPVTIQDANGMRFFFH